MTLCHETPADWIRYKYHSIGSLLFKYSNKNYVCVSQLRPVHNMFRPSLHPWDKHTWNLTLEVCLLPYLVKHFPKNKYSLTLLFKCEPTFFHHSTAILHSFIAWHKIYQHIFILLFMDFHSHNNYISRECKMERMTGFLPLSPGHFSWQTLARVSQSLRPFCLSHMIAATGKAKEYWHLHHSHSMKTLLCAYMTSPSLPTCEIRLGLLTLHGPGAGDFLEFILLYGGFQMGRKSH
jgi:hypothetical protein